MKLLHIGLDADKNSSLDKTFKRHVAEYRAINTSESNLELAISTMLARFTPDVVFMQIQTPGVVSHDSLNELKDSGAFVINWTGDVRYPLPRWYIETGKRIDLTLFTNMPDVYAARQTGINADFCAIGYDPDIYRPDYNTKKDIEVAFFGNNYGTLFPLSEYRRKMVMYLKHEFGSRFKVFGNGWGNPDGNYNHSQHEEAKVLRRCKIAINLSHYNYERYSSDRLNRILGCGVMCITHEFEGMQDLGLQSEYPNNCATFKDFSDLSEKINYYLENEEHRRLTAARGHKMATEKLTFDNMIESLLSFYKIEQHKMHGVE